MRYKFRWVRNRRNLKKKIIRLDLNFKAHYIKIFYLH